MRTWVKLGLSIALFACLVLAVGAPASAADTEHETVAVWNEELYGPLPRVREGGTPHPPANQRQTPYALVRQEAQDAPNGCLVSSPPEYSPSEGIVLRYSQFAFPEITTDLVKEITEDPTKDDVVYVVVNTTSTQNTATAQFTAAGADMSKVKYILKPTDTIWLRDYGPHFIWQGGARAIVDSHYYPGRASDNFIPTLIADEFFRQQSYDIGMYYSGGNFQPGPNRTGFVTGLINTDNPASGGFSPTVLGEIYDKYQGIDTLHILPQLPVAVDGTGHIDMWFYLVDEDTVMISEFPAGSNASAISITNNAVTYMENLGFEVFRLPDRNCTYNFGTNNCPAAVAGVHYTYANAFRLNDRIFIPKYGSEDPDPDVFDTLDAQALATWQTAAGPGVEIIPIHSFDIIPAAGTIHCIVMQVPKHTDTVPSDCVNSPSGGEALVAGATHMISWSASDDTAVDHYDLYYSTDGSNYSPIVEDLSGNRIEHEWEIPLVESDTAWVKVVANDDETNSFEATSAQPFAIESALRHEYDFSTGAGVDKFAWGHQTSSWNTNVNNVRMPTGMTQLSAANYLKIAVSDATGSDLDANRYQAATPTTGFESTHVFEIRIDEDPAMILDIGILWEGYANDCAQVELYVWDYDTGQWSDASGAFGQNAFVDNQASNRDAKLEGHIRSNFDSYLDPNGMMTLLLYNERPTFSGSPPISGQTFHDYLSVTVAHEACFGADGDVDGWGNDCDNCPTTHSTNQIDEDGDLRGNVCDCAPQDGGAYGMPSLINGVRMDSQTMLAWDSDAGNAGSGIVYDVLRGTIGVWTPEYGDTCLDPGAGESFDDLDVPLVDTGFYYLVRGSNSCGLGSYGTDSASAERLSTVCP